MKVCLLIGGMLVLVAFDWSPANADLPLSQRTPNGIANFTATLPGVWTQLPQTAGGQVAFGYAVGMPKQIICTFSSQDRARPMPFTVNPGWENSLKEDLTERFRKKPSEMFGYLMQRMPNVTIEDHFVTVGAGSVAATSVYSYDENAIVSGKALTFRDTAYDTMVVSPYAVVKSVCVTLRTAYDANQERLMRRVRDSIAIQGPE